MPPKVFISYSHDSEEHRDLVLSFTDRLRKDGVDCIIDQYEPSPPEGWSRWAINQIEKAKFVLVVCTNRYSQLFTGKGETIEKQANYQGAIITQSIYESQANTKFIPIVFSAKDSSYVPIILRSATKYTIDTVNGYDELYRRLTDQHATPILGLGKTRQLPPRFRQQFFLPEDTYSSLKEEFASASRGLLNWKRTLGNDDLEIPRPELEQLKHLVATDTDSTTIVLGVPGSGKSALLATLGHWAVSEKYALLAIKADYLSNTISTMEDLQHDGELQLSRKPEAAITAIASQEKVILLIDQLDAVAELLDRKPQRLNLLLQLIQRLSDIKNVHIIATCREFEFRYGSQFARIETIERLQLNLPQWGNIVPILEGSGHQPIEMGESLQELLKNPLHLSIFLDVAQPGDNFISSQKLLDRLWEKQVQTQSEPEKCVAFLEDLAERMTQEEVLWLPKAIAETSLRVWQSLEQAGILTTNSENSTIGFQHQTYYDHTLARGLARGAQSLADLVLERQDGLFIRPILLRCLDYLRGTATQQYHQQLKILLEPDQQKIRLHIRTLVIEFAGAQFNPDRVEAGIFIPLLNSVTEGIKVLDVTVSSPGWFRKFRDRAEFRQWLEQPIDRANYCLPLLTVAAGFAPDDVWNLLEEYWLHDRAYDFLSIRVAYNFSEWTLGRVRSIQSVIRRSNIDWYDVAAIAEKIAKTLPNLNLKVIRAHLDYCLEQAVEASTKIAEIELNISGEEKLIFNYHNNPRKNFEFLLKTRTEFSEFRVLAKDNSMKFLEEIWSWFVDIIGRLVVDYGIGATRYCQDISINLQFDRGEIIDAIIIAIEQLAIQDPNAFNAFISQTIKSDFLIVQCLLARGLEKIAHTQPQVVLNYLLGDPRRLSLGNISEDEERETKILIRESVPYMTVEDRERLERAIFDFNYYAPTKNTTADLRFRELKYNRRHRLKLLLAFPDDCLSNKAKQVKQEELRAFPWILECEGRSSFSGGFVGPRMTKDEMSKATDEQLLNLFNELCDSTDGRIRTSKSGDFSRSGDVFQQASEFSKLVQNDPARFLRILPELKPQIHESYIGQALSCLAGDNIPSKNLIDLVEQLDQQGFVSETFQSEAASALRKVATRDRGLPTQILVLMRSWLCKHTDPKLEYYRSNEDSRADLKYPILFRRMGGSHSLPNGRGEIVRAIAQGYLQQNPSNLQGWTEFIKSQLGIENHPAVWVDILSSMPPLLNGNPVTATELFDRVIRNCPEVLQYTWTLYFVTSAIGLFDPKETVRGWLEIMESNNSNFSQQAYGEMLLVQYLRYADEWSVQKIRHHLTTPNSEAILCGLAHAASHLWSMPRCRALAAEILYSLSSSANPSIQHAVANVFQWSQERFQLDPGMLKIIGAVCRNPGLLLESANYLVEIIEAEELVDNNPEVVAEVCQSLVALSAELTNQSRSVSLVVDSLTTTAIELHRHPDYREVGLQIFEGLLALNLRETRAALETLDRRPNRQGFYVPPRRRFRRR
jgi:hypothetical protein